MAITALLVPAGTDLAGRCIGLFEHDDVVHVSADCGDGWTIAAEIQGIWGRPIETFSNPEIIRWALPLTAAEEAKARWWLRSQVGTRYEVEQIAADAANVLLHTHVQDGDDGRYVCSSLLAMACVQAGHDLFPGTPTLQVTPANWHTLVTASQAVTGALQAAEVQPAAT